MKMTRYNSNEQKEIEKSIIFTVKTLSESCHNEKPVILHSLRVGMRLMENDQSLEVIQAGFLHDLLEDSDCLPSTIKNQFGEKVLNLVDVLTFDASITDYKNRWDKSIDAMEKFGKDAMFIKIIDNMDNLPYYIIISDETKRQEVLWKHKLTIERLDKYLKEQKLFEDYKKMVSEIMN